MKMDRVHYRRHTPSQLHTSRPAPERSSYQVHNKNQHTQSTAPQSENGGFREKLIVQGIISGVIFAVILILGMVDDPQAVSIRANLNQAISDHVTAEQVSTEIHRFLGNGSQRFFGEGPAYIEAPVYIEGPVYPYLDSAPILERPYPAEEMELWQSEGLPDAQHEGQIATPRIDEDMLREILGWTEGDDLQTTAPEPIAPPEL